jgi:hypothetical protein
VGHDGDAEPVDADAKRARLLVLKLLRADLRGPGDELSAELAAYESDDVLAELRGGTAEVKGHAAVTATMMCEAAAYWLADLTGNTPLEIAGTLYFKVVGK